MSSELTFGDNSYKSSILKNKNLVDRDHDWTHNWSRQGESDCSLTRNKLTGADKGNPTVESNKLSFICCLLSNVVVRSVRI